MRTADLLRQGTSAFDGGGSSVERVILSYELTNLTNSSTNEEIIAAFGGAPAIAEFETKMKLSDVEFIIRRSNAVPPIEDNYPCVVQKYTALGNSYEIGFFHGLIYNYLKFVKTGETWSVTIEGEEAERFPVYLDYDKINALTTSSDFTAVDEAFASTGGFLTTIDMLGKMDTMPLFSALPDGSSVRYDYSILQWIANAYGDDKTFTLVYYTEDMNTRIHLTIRYTHATTSVSVRKDEISVVVPETTKTFILNRSMLETLTPTSTWLDIDNAFGGPEKLEEILTEIGLGATPIFLLRSSEMDSNRVGIVLEFSIVFDTEETMLSYYYDGNVYTYVFHQLNMMDMKTLTSKTITPINGGGGASDVYLLPYEMRTLVETSTSEEIIAALGGNKLDENYTALEEGKHSFYIGTTTGLDSKQFPILSYSISITRFSYTFRYSETLDKTVELVKTGDVWACPSARLYPFINQVNLDLEDVLALNNSSTREQVAAIFGGEDKMSELTTLFNDNSQPQIALTMHSIPLAQQVTVYCEEVLYFDKDITIKFFYDNKFITIAMRADGVGNPVVRTEVDMSGGGGADILYLPYPILTLTDTSTSAEIVEAFGGEATMEEFKTKMQNETTTIVIQDADVTGDIKAQYRVISRRYIRPPGWYELMVAYIDQIKFLRIQLSGDQWSVIEFWTREITDIGSSGSTKYTQTFEDADLTTSNITIAHNLNTEFPMVSVYNSEKKQVIPDEVIITDANNIQLQMPSFTPLVGTYTVIVL